MSEAGLCVLVPALGALAAGALAHRREAVWLHAGVCLATLALALRLCWDRPDLEEWLDDPLALAASVLTALVALAGAVGTLGPARTPGAARPDGTAARPDLAPALALALLASLLLGLLCSAVIVSWLAVAAAMTVVTAAPLLDGPPGHAAFRRAALPGAAALALSLLGTILLGLCGTPAAASLATPVAGSLQGSWSLLLRPDVQLDGALLGLACVLCLAGYALAAGLAPLHGWLAGLQRTSPPATAVLLGAPLPGLALLLLLRLDRVAGSAGLSLPGDALLALGLASVLLAGLALCARGKAETAGLVTLLHGGIVATAFGLGSTAAVYAGLLHMAASTLARTAGALGATATRPRPASPPAGPGARVAASPAPVSTRPVPDGRTGRDGMAGVGRAGSAETAEIDHEACSGLRRVTLLALAGVPPLGLFSGEFLLLAALLGHHPMLAVLFLLGLLAAATGLVGQLRSPGPAPAWPARAAAWTLLAAMMLTGLALPSTLADWLTRIAETFATQA